MRIISGNFKGKKIFLPDDKYTRPLKDLVKESLFNIIEHSFRKKFNIFNSKILDLFSGSGSFGLECFSRGAQEIIFIENYSKAIEVLNKNINLLKGNEKCSVIQEDCFDFIAKIEVSKYKFDIIFIDPPFKEEKINYLINLIKKKNILNKQGILIIHRHKKDNVELSESVNILDIRSYGISKIIIGN